MFRNIIYTILLVFVLYYAKAEQETHIDSVSPTLFFQAGGYSGFTLAHHRSMSFLIDDYARGAEFRVGWKFNGRKAWEHVYRYPSVGLGYMALDFGSPRIFGYGHTLFGFINIPIVKSNRFAWTYEMGTGIAFVTKKFDGQTNPNNGVIGSHLNAFLLISTGLEYNVSKHTSFLLNVGLNHCSNGNSSGPNLGLNTLFMSMSAKRMIGEPRTVLQSPKIPFNRNWELYSFVGSGVKEVKPFGSKRAFVSNIHFTARRKISYSNAWGGGIDLMYDTGIDQMKKSDYELDDLERDSINSPKIMDRFAPGVHANWSVFFGKVVFDIQMGVYIYNSLGKMIYNRWTLEFEITNKFSLAVGLKSHFATAEYIQLGVIWHIVK
ncbi:MAG: acyloxyacyl hydrolase [Salinivirgaceae bacterium]|nr:acyloxyacyl hydrolase [Salinivirgaceae bacterium]MDD4747647.1 acyloxyacyl hydrolase [Salinivirgaceae bacterium]